MHKIQDDESGESAIFIKKVVTKNGKLEAEKISVEEAKEKLDQKQKPLFHIHGFSNKPTQFLSDMQKEEKKINEFNLVPVCWPSLLLSANKDDHYKGSQGLSKNAGLAFQKLKDAIDVFTNKSIMCHSMGNRVLRYAAASNFKFDNIFMAAAVSKIICDSSI